MPRRFRPVHWLEVGCCFVGGILCSVSFVLSKKVRCIESALRLGNLSGMVFSYELSLEAADFNSQAYIGYCAWIIPNSTTLTYCCVLPEDKLDLKELTKLIPVLVAVTGRAWSDRPKATNIALRPAVIVRVRQTIPLTH